MRKVALPLLALLPTACHTAAPPPKPVTVAPAPSASAATKTSDVPLGPGKVRFVLFPADVQARDALDLGPRGVLYVGDGGERWLVEKEGAAPTPAAQLAPEDLVAAREIGGAILLLGASGTIYTAKGPLADLDAKRPPPAEMRSVSAGRAVFVGVTKEGRVLRTTDGGATWAPAKLPKGDAVPLAVLFTARREGLVLAAPQRVFATQDDGATFEAVGSPVAARALHRGKDDALFVEGRGLGATVADGTAAPNATITAKLVRDGGVPRLVAAPRTQPSLWLPLAEYLPFLGHATAIREGRAVLVDGKLHEVALTEIGQYSVVALATTEPGKLPVVRAIPGLSHACEDPSVSAVAGVLHVACTELVEAKDGSTSRRLRVRRSDDAGATWSDAGVLDVGPSGVARVWSLGARGWLASKGDEGLVVHAEGKAAAPKIAGLQEPPFIHQVLVAGSGDRVYVLAFDGERMVLLVSKDAGKSFVTRPLPELEPELPPTDPGPGFAIEEHAGAPPTVTVYLSWNGTLRLETNDDGATFAATQLPIPATQLSMAGARGLATDGVTGWETIDAGRTWTEVALPTRRAASTSEDLACWDGGCVLADRGARIGWEIAGPADVKPWSEPPPKAAKAATSSRVLTCAPTGAPVPLGRPTAVPVEVGPHAWLAVRDDRQSGAVTVVVPAAPKKGSTDLATREIPLLAKGKGPAAGEDAAWSAATPDGAIALRFAAKAKGSGATSDVELAWYVASTGKVHRARLAGGAMADRALHDRDPDGSPRAKASAVIVPGFGLWVRPSAVKGDADLWLVREGSAKGSKVALPKPWPVGTLAGARVGGKSLFALVHREWNDAQTVLFGLLDDAGKTWTQAAWSAWPSLAARAGSAARSALATIDGKPSIVVSHPGDDALAPKAWALPLEAAAIADGTPEPRALPLYDALAGAGAEERPCAAKTSGPAIEIPYPSAARPKVLVGDGPAKRSYSYSNAVVRMPKGKDACVASLVVLTGSAAITPNTDQIVVPLDDPEHATLFRTKYVGKERAHEAVAATCSFAK